MRDWRKTLIGADATIFDAVESLNKSSAQIALVVDENESLLGIITDGDIRRGLLAGNDFQSPATGIMCRTYQSVGEDEINANILRLMSEKEIRQVPVVGENGRVLGLKLLLDMVSAPKHDNHVVLMAGGLGTRLRPLTNDCPKPLLAVGGRPILETILRQFIDHGFEHFHLSVNYRAEMVQDYFGDGSKFGVQIEYIHEKEQLGTAGALGLLPEVPNAPIFVMNGDLLTNVDYGKMMDFHIANEAVATMAVRNLEMQVPYGVVEVEEGRVQAIQEKPIKSFFVNAGVYVLSPEIVAEIPKDEYLDMPTLFDKQIELNRKAAAFPVHEYWVDIGQMKDFEQANSDYEVHFDLPGSSE
ncbi:nucleotidyltransferase family protein [Pseudodesulfovibrio sp. zrk46]|uniref:nucleotidyltransferase family protein n=1 Tax=Pseudodesulfovibrio sp. zrk46 TaxID=2725288 RepID=UPI001449B5F7|nr:nucleotidyltransferase family protein [Pseudodesulfovibrio sp. zrk46]QJB56576.1 CBS domain-containing protein [Pseudodesulfovibrio sp. zrk46]